MHRIDLRGRRLDRRSLRQALPRAAFDVDAALAVVRPICEDVRLRGATALRELTERFDGVRPDSLRVPQGVLTLAVKRLDPSLHDALQEAIARVRRVHADQRRTDVCTQVVPGGMVRERFVPVDRVGLYVPGGLAALVSSVVMNVVPAQAAGVPSLAVASPPRRDNPAEFAGYPDPAILAAAELLGVGEVYAVGGAQAIAMFAYGASEPDRADRDGRLTPGAVVCEPVDLVTGPGSIYVVAAKRLLKGQVGIDSEAGPSEIAVLADSSADPVFLAADLISQAEHDVLAASVLVTDDPALADRVDAVLQERVSLTKHADRIRAALTGEQSAVVLVDDLDAGLLVVDAYAAEHLEVHTREAPSVAARVRNAGAIFVGAHSPVSLGDYAAGSNHVLPTGGAAAFGGGLSVQTFLRGIHVVEYDAAALAEVGERVVVLAEAEDLPAHGEAIRARLDLGS